MRTLLISIHFWPVVWTGVALLFTWTQSILNNASLFMLVHKRAQPGSTIRALGAAHFRCCYQNLFKIGATQTKLI